MVLQDLGDAPTASDGFDDNPYPSDSDPYSSPSSSSSRSSSSTRRFDPSQCPQPIPVIGSLLGYPASLMISRTETTINFAEQKIGRAVTYDEAQALAGHLYQMEQTSSYFTAIGVGLGALRCYQTAAVNRYPFLLPKPGKIDPNKFLFLKGPLAQNVRHSWRGFLYMFVAGEFAKLCGQVVARPTAAQATANDPRMAKFTEELRAVSARQNASQARQVAEAREGGRTQNPAAGASSQSEPAASRHRKVVPRETANPSQDASPTAGNDSWSSASEGDFVSSSDAAQYNSSKPEPAQRTHSNSSWARQPRSNEDDDASPTGGLFQDEVQSQSRPGESSWDRLRRGGAPGASSPSQRPPPRRSDPPRREQRGDSTRGSSSDSFPFVGEDRNEVQAQAQQEFDARMQRERDGKDFNEEKRW
jgi:hypothetical protein